MKRYSPKRSLSILSAGLVSFLLLVSCSKEEIVPVKPKSNQPVTPTGANSYVNSWILKEMKYWYLWSDDIPASPDQNLDPESYFKSLLSSEDRFSWIQTNYQELLNSLQGISKEAGYEYVLYREREGSSNIIVQVLYTKTGSPAEEAGLKRGDIITHINGEQITTTNYRDLLGALKQNHSVTFKPIIINEEKFGEPETLSLTAVEFTENPNYLHKIIEVDNKKIGYFVYNFFASGTDAQPGKYDAETDAVFEHFKSKGITDLVIDLRFNSGGSESSARNLASLIGKNVDKSKVFLTRQYNQKVQDAILNDESLGEGYLTSYYNDEAANIGGQLSSGRVYILTGSRTASASELIINALKPFMDVFLIGDVTYGKNVGSISLFEENDPKNTWGLQPIVVKVYNSLGQSDYGNGFQPNVKHPDSGINIYPLGDPREALLSKAIAEITGTASVSREARDQREPVAHSLDFKRRSYNLVMDVSELPELE